MTGRRLRRLVVAALALTVFAIPVVGAVLYSLHQASELTRERASLYARDVLHRSDQTAEQADAGLTRLAATAPASPCAPAQQQLMRQIDVASGYLQAVGAVEHNRLVCSSLGGDQQIDLGPVDFVSPGDVEVRTAVRPPFGGGSGFLVAERYGFAALIHEDLALDVAPPGSGVTLATVALPSGRVLTSRGHVDPAWLNRFDTQGATSYVHDGRPVASTTSRRYYYGTLAALPASALHDQLVSTLWHTVPFGILVGIALATAVAMISRTRLTPAATMRTALRRDEFFVAYQPVHEMETGRCLGAEALLRWRRSDGSLTRPDVFIPEAEDAGMMGGLTERMLAIVADEAGDLFRLNPDFHLALNLSAEDLHHPRIVARLVDLAARLGAPPGGLVVEITERVFVEPDLAGPVLKDLRAAGISVALDDFGTGYSSLASLQSFELDYLKIDKSFVDTLGTDAATSQVVFHIIEMAGTLGLSMVAEGVETSEQVKVLRERGVALGQGWYYGRPVPLSELLAALKAPQSSDAQELRSSPEPRPPAGR